MTKKSWGITLLIGAVILVGIVYPMRPPSGFTDAALRSDRPLLTEGAFYTLLIIAAIMAIFGIVKLSDGDNK
ncbi:hypothetical protein [Tritonibacter mobilis]|uniref:Uncharacterized protein n=1 Tax=Tritonibacter mobilis F1926 TaxID=1265309 RepID=A0A1B1A0W8_9RHOB|nr:hypothetical protein [Tritonibacter mobilis]ANP40213.1 hypothetical protein K529_005480 [Tritonibacter mobilis F1926]KJZ25415.1 hypothetical protein TW79_07125 [Tritonibacter mobilis]